MKILLIEDEPAVGDVIKTFLEFARFEVVWLQDGHAALDHWRMHKDEFVLVCTDTALPGLTGYEIIAAIRAERPHTLIVQMSAMHSPDPRANAFWPKGDPKMLLPIVEQVLA